MEYCSDSGLKQKLLQMGFRIYINSPNLLLRLSNKVHPQNYLTLKRFQRIYSGMLMILTLFDKYHKMRALDATARHNIIDYVY